MCDGKICLKCIGLFVSNGATVENCQPVLHRKTIKAVHIDRTIKLRYAGHWYIAMVVQFWSFGIEDVLLLQRIFISYHQYTSD